jgi:hypothetical protein
MCFVIYHQNPLSGLDIFHELKLEAMPKGTAWGYAEGPGEPLEPT